MNCISECIIGILDYVINVLMGFSCIPIILKLTDYFDFTDDYDWYQTCIPLCTCIMLKAIIKGIERCSYRREVNEMLNIQRNLRS